MTGLQGWKVATIRGVELRVHFTLVFLLFYIIVVASAQFPYVAEQSGFLLTALHGTPELWGTAFAFGLFLSIVLHEFGHVLVAQSMGVKVRDVTLMMLGGVSEMENLPRVKYAEFKVAVMGPLVSFAIAGALLLLKAVTSNPELAFFCFWLGRVNLVLGVFNLFPAFPLDGGRAFRSLLSAYQGPVRATQTATSVAKIFAWALGAWGVLSFNLILALIAYFIYSSAKREWTLVLGRSTLSRIPASEIGILTKSLQEDQTLDEALAVMKDSKHIALPVETAIGLPGILKLSVLNGIRKKAWDKLKVRDVMDHPTKAIQRDESLDISLAELANFTILPLMDHTRLVGIVRFQDLDELLGLSSLEPPSSKTDRNQVA